MTAENKEIGFIKIYRSMLTWEWWDDINTFRLFMTILFMANWKEKKWHGKTIPRGSFFTSLSSLSKKSGLSVKQVRNSLNKLISTNEVASERASNGRLITVVNYDFYQDLDEIRASNRASNRADRGQTKGKRGATTKERKESKEVKECICMCATTTKEFWDFLSEKDIDKIYKAYPNTAGILIDEVAKDAVERKVEIKAPAKYILGYARRKNWDDERDLAAEVLGY